jgi:hypothetical protein
MEQYGGAVRHQSSRRGLKLEAGRSLRHGRTLPTSSVTLQRTAAAPPKSDPSSPAPSCRHHSSTSPFINRC